MARKHNLKRNRVKQPVQMTAVTPVKAEDRKVLLNPETGEYEVVRPEPVFKQGRALGSTINRTAKKKGKR